MLRFLSRNPDKKRIRELTATLEKVGESMDALIQERNRLQGDAERLREAVGLATMALPNMVMDVDDPVGMMQKVVAEVEDLQELTESAWGLIANAYGGDWDLAQNSDWKPAAIRWRDAYHKTLPSSRAKVETA